MSKKKKGEPESLENNPVFTGENLDGDAGKDDTENTNALEKAVGTPADEPKPEAPTGNPGEGGAYKLVDGKIIRA